VGHRPATDAFHGTMTEKSADGPCLSHKASARLRTEEKGRPRTPELRPRALELRPRTLELRPRTLELRPRTLELRPRAEWGRRFGREKGRFGAENAHLSEKGAILRGNRPPSRVNCLPATTPMVNRFTHPR
jgi:hypothetical protein